METFDFGRVEIILPGIQRKPHTKHCFIRSSSMQLLFGIHIMTPRQIRWRKCRDEGTKIYINGPGHMSKMAAMAINGKNLYNSSTPEPEDLRI